MDIEAIREYCLSLPFVEEYTPFDDVTLCLKVGGLEKGKIFAFLPLEASPYRINLKYYPDQIEEVRESYPQIVPGYHMNKQHWNTVYFEDGLSSKFLKELIDVSYDLVYKSLTLKLKKELESI
jgi:predicted DNA-binding protein (MmcQ/YjbR family)